MATQNLAEGKAAKAPDAALISELFHNLSQPLTALHCILDLALQRDRSLEQLRASVQTALDSAECLRQRLLLIRLLNDAGTVPESSALIDLGELLEELAGDMAPLFASAEREFRLDIRGRPLPVRADKARVVQALFAFTEYLFRYLPKGERVSFSVDRKECQVELCIDAASCLPVGPQEGERKAPYSCEAELLHRTFVASGGDFAFDQGDAARSVWTGTLPLAPAASSLKI
jgi:signal transduction histidine kinase